MAHFDIEVDAGTRGVAIAGPTASGKSALALRLAERHGGVVINADAMQVYRDLKVLTARPGAAEEARIPHRLYGHVDGTFAYSVAAWTSDTQAALEETRAARRLPILVGGTGLYLKMFFNGLSDLPQVPQEVRERWRERASREGAPALHAELARRDPRMAARLSPTDPQRIVRALEVWEATGRSLADWQTDPVEPPEDPAGWKRLVLEPDRAALYARIDARVTAMVVEGALDEVAALRARGLDRDLPVMRAIGVAELTAHLSGEYTLDQAVEAIRLATRRYAKRQGTWLRTQMPGWTRAPVQLG